MKPSPDKPPKDEIIVVSGLPRSGTSMLMKMLEAGGIPPLTDHIRKADEDNPKGYYEYERAKHLPDDSQWLADAKGKSVKIISMLLQHLPPEHSYKIIFAQRNMAEILASQKQMLIQRNEPHDKVSDDKMATIYNHHLKQVSAWLTRNQEHKVLYINYNDILSFPQKNCIKINNFLDTSLNVDNMVGVIDSSLYRQRNHRP